MYRAKATLQSSQVVGIYVEDASLLLYDFRRIFFSAMLPRHSHNTVKDEVSGQLFFPITGEPRNGR
jgi:hypothetical protein